MGGVRDAREYAGDDELSWQFKQCYFVLSHWAPYTSNSEYLAQRLFDTATNALPPPSAQSILHCNSLSS